MTYTRRGRARPRKRVDKPPGVAEATTSVVDKTEPAGILSDVKIGAQIVEPETLTLELSVSREQSRTIGQRLEGVRVDLMRLIREIEMLANWLARRAKS